MITFREPPFDRVWVRTHPERPFLTTYGLEKEFRTIECEVHSDIGPGGVEYAKREIGEIVLYVERWLRFAPTHWGDSAESVLGVSARRRDRRPAQPY